MGGEEEATPRSDVDHHPQASWCWGLTVYFRPCIVFWYSDHHFIVLGICPARIDVTDALATSWCFYVCYAYPSHPELILSNVNVLNRDLRRYIRSTPQPSISGILSDIYVV